MSLTITANICTHYVAFTLKTICLINLSSNAIFALLLYFIIIKHLYILVHAIFPFDNQSKVHVFQQSTHILDESIDGDIYK